MQKKKEQDFRIETYSFYSSILSLIIFSLVLFVMARFIPSFSIGINSSNFLNGANETRLYMQMITINPQNLSRITLGYKSWSRDFAKLFPKSILRVCSPIPIPFERDYQFLTRWNTSIPPIQNFLFTFIDCLHDFYYSTDYDWFIRTTEDCLVDIRKLPKYIQELEKYRDPKKDYVLKGHLIRSNVIVKGTNYGYIHGGSGWIMSRASAKQFIDNENEYIKSFFSEYVKGDDVITFDMMNMMRLSPHEVNSKYFMGYPLDDASNEMIKTNNYDRAETCSNTENKLVPDLSLKDIVFWHSGRADMLALTDGYRILSEVPDGYNVYFDKEKGHICKKEYKKKQKW